MNKTKLMTLTALLTAINVTLSTFITIPIGPIKAMPMQHLINVICAVILGPWYGLLQALLSSTVRNILGIGTIFAFPGSMIGVLLASLLYKYRRKLYLASLGEVVGTGVIGSIVCIPISWLLGFGNLAFWPLFISFLLSSLFGAIASYIILISFERRGILKHYIR
ncbi:energy coupling factor transporter S component ThiW [Mammaliicoccus stepanovicii]|uniref:Substrate-specific component ThiW of thiazole ECF transporter n=1 Tax=Mammaliicoccus stepanovicii TaxID=643214 RepID=A0A239ZFU3_9STAP|nr:energy coupling factor transporter S component ThiW [Mammaliicoccus stepanovicii]PNZ79013.1 energy coupling factor transporter S component ThiW [Mammaliicoccus stepanovicii]GGI41898.1 energy coupling factor transporter S component ThiW [Mammaliicoccus stepanovicii]SNV69919.1 substrate-specific component ThiW of thiazole ECF transporter [Mammaliicoccus stepanovicii]